MVDRIIVGVLEVDTQAGAGRNQNKLDGRAGA